MDVQLKEFDSSITAKQFFTDLLAMALDNESLCVRGFTERGGCIIRFHFEVDSIDYATAFHTDPETRH